MSESIKMYDTFKDDLQKVQDTYPYTLYFGFDGDYNKKMIENCISSGLFTNDEIMLIANDMFYKKYGYETYASISDSPPFDSIKMIFKPYNTRTIFYFKNEQDMFFFKFLK